MDPTSLDARLRAVRFGVDVGADVTRVEAALADDDGEARVDHLEVAAGSSSAAALAEEARTLLRTSGPVVREPELRHRVYVVLARAWEAMGSSAALDPFAAIIDEDPTSARGLGAAVASSAILREAGEIDAAIEVGRTALAATEQGGPTDATAEPRVRLAVTLAAALYEDGRREEALDLCQEAVAWAQGLDADLARAAVEWNVGIMVSEAGHVDRALTLALRALETFEASDRVRDTGRLRLFVGSVMLAQSPPWLEEAAAQLAQLELELDWSRASPVDHARARLLRAQVRYRQGRFSEARAGAADAVARTDDLPVLRASALVVAAQVEWAAHDHEAARRLFRSAIETLTAIGSDREAAQAWFDLAHLLAAAGQHDDARDAFRRAAASRGLAG